MKNIEGYRTYITAGLLVVATGLHALGWVDDKTYENILAVLGAGGLAFLRSSVESNAARAATGQAVLAEHLNVPTSTIEAKITAPAGVEPPAKGRQ